MSDLVDSDDDICRDDDCRRPGVHVRHPVLKRGRVISVHHRPKTGVKPIWERDDPKALTGAVMRATSKAWPTHFMAIWRDVQDDYGRCSERSVYRHIAKLVARGQLLKLELGLAFAVYIRPKSRLLRDLPSIREYMMGQVEMNPTTKRIRPIEEIPERWAARRGVATLAVEASS